MGPTVMQYSNRDSIFRQSEGPPGSRSVQGRAMGRAPDRVGYSAISVYGVRIRKALPAMS